MNKGDVHMKMHEYDENVVMEYYNMLQDAPSIKEICRSYPGVDDLIHALTAQLATNFVLPFLENKMSVDDLVESFRRFLITALAFGIVLHRSDLATDYIMNIYEQNKPEASN